MPLVLALAACAPKAPPTPPLYAGPVYGWTEDGRQIRVFVPPDAAPDEAFPLVLVLGGYSWRSWELAEALDLVEEARRRRWLLVAPEGSIDAKGNPFWAATDTCCDWYGAGVDDVAFLADVVRRVRAEHPAEAGTLAVVGHSNGGFMGYALACSAGVRVTHLVSLAGSSALDPTDCAVRGQLALLQVHGTEDDIMPLEGDPGAPAAREVVERWACGPLSEGALPEGVGPGRALTAQACPVALWILDGGTHDVPAPGPLRAAVYGWLDATLAAPATPVSPTPSPVGPAAPRGAPGR